MAELSGTVGTVPTVPLFLAGTANRTTIWTEKNNFEMKKGYYLLTIVYYCAAFNCVLQFKVFAGHFYICYSVQQIF
jgi:hypothetical protein